MNGAKRCNGMLVNPSKPFFLEMVVTSVRDVNRQVDKKFGISYARKAMMRCGLSLNIYA